MHGFHHLLFVGTFFEATLGVGINTIGALNGMSNGKCNKGFFAGGKCALFKYLVVVVKKFSC
jgi:hypothetical protein